MSTVKGFVCISFRMREMSIGVDNRVSVTSLYIRVRDGFYACLSDFFTSKETLGR